MVLIECKAKKCWQYCNNCESINGHNMIPVKDDKENLLTADELIAYYRGDIVPKSVIYNN